MGCACSSLYTSCARRWSVSSAACARSRVVIGRAGPWQKRRLPSRCPTSRPLVPLPTLCYLQKRRARPRRPSRRRRRPRRRGSRCLRIQRRSPTRRQLSSRRRTRTPPYGGGGTSAGGGKPATTRRPAYVEQPAFISEGQPAEVVPVAEQVNSAGCGFVIPHLIAHLTAFILIIVVPLPFCNATWSPREMR